MNQQNASELSEEALLYKLSELPSEALYVRLRSCENAIWDMLQDTEFQRVCMSAGTVTIPNPVDEKALQASDLSEEEVYVYNLCSNILFQNKPAAVIQADVEIQKLVQSLMSAAQSIRKLASVFELPNDVKRLMNPQMYQEYDDPTLESEESEPNEEVDKQTDFSDFPEFGYDAAAQQRYRERRVPQDFGSDAEDYPDLSGELGI